MKNFLEENNGTDEFPRLEIPGPVRIMACSCKNASSASLYQIKSHFCQNRFFLLEIQIFYKP